MPRSNHRSSASVFLFVFLAIGAGLDIVACSLKKSVHVEPVPELASDYLVAARALLRTGDPDDALEARTNVERALARSSERVGS